MKIGIVGINIGANRGDKMIEFARVAEEVGSNPSGPSSIRWSPSITPLPTLIQPTEQRA